jgi:prepilin-type N-terminal cleavage/methylation domain-containing protein
MRFADCSFGRRPGFTLVELLVIIAIIAVLVALTAGGIFQVMDSQRKSNTEETLRKLASTLKQQWEEVRRTANSENMPDTFVQSQGGGDAFRARPLWIQAKLAYYFPQTFAEAFTPPNGLPALYAKDLQNMGIVQGGTLQPAGGEGAVLLLLILRRRNGGVAFNEDTLGSHAIGKANPSGSATQQVPMLIDDWGNPLAFFRSPGGNLEPVVVSAGRDGMLGLNLADPNMTVTDANAASDNLYSNRRIGARGD